MAFISDTTPNKETFEPITKELQQMRAIINQCAYWIEQGRNDLAHRAMNDLNIDAVDYAKRLWDEHIKKNPPK